MKTGKVKFFNNEKGFGFITSDDSNQDVFVHKSGVIGQIREDDQVEFELEDTPKGPSAVNVKKN